MGLIQHPAAIPGMFDERRAGLDHVGFAVPTRSDLDDWAGHLDTQGVRRSGVVSAPYAHMINFRDRDGIALELSVINADFWMTLLEKAVTPRRRVSPPSWLLLDITAMLIAEPWKTSPSERIGEVSDNDIARFVWYLGDLPRTRLTPSGSRPVTRPLGRRNFPLVRA